MASKIVALFVEGPTEKEFYKAVIKHMRALKNCPFPCSIEYIDMKGIGNYKKSALRKFNDLKKKNPGTDIYPFLCIDNDVFEFSKRPPFNKQDVLKSLKDAGAKNPKYIVATQSIEDWFLYDLKGVLEFLGINKHTKCPDGTGQNALKELFRRASKLYVKGSECKGFVDKLNIGRIMSKCCGELKPLCKALKLSCQLTCGKKKR